MLALRSYQLFWKLCPHNSHTSKHCPCSLHLHMYVLQGRIHGVLEVCQYYKHYYCFTKSKLAFNLDWILFCLFPQPWRQRYWVTRMWVPFKRSQAVHKAWTPQVSLWRPFFQCKFTRVQPEFHLGREGKICLPHPWNLIASTYLW